MKRHSQSGSQACSQSASCSSNGPRKISSREKSPALVAAKDILKGPSRYSKVAIDQKPRAAMALPQTNRSAHCEYLAYQEAMQDPDVLRQLQELEREPIKDIKKLMQDPEIAKHLEDLDRNIGGSSSRSQMVPPNQELPSDAGYPARQVPAHQVFVQAKGKALPRRPRPRKEQQEPEDMLTQMFHEAEQKELEAERWRRSRGGRSLDELMQKVSSMVDTGDSDVESDVPATQPTDSVATDKGRLGSRGRKLQELLQSELEMN